MQTISVQSKSFTPSAQRVGWWQQYLAFCDRQARQPMLWFLLPLTTITCIFMPVSISLVYFLAPADFYLLFVVLTMLSFFANILFHVAGAGTRVTITAYLLTMAINIAGPILAAFI